jgi:hypothetical protein
MFSTALLLLFVAQTQATVPKTVNSFDDIEIGMPRDFAIAELTKQGFALRDSFSGNALLRDREWQVLYKDKAIGSFSVANGRITAAEINVYDSGDPPSGSIGAIGIGEALYWIFHDNGLPISADDRDFKETRTAAQISTRDVEMRTPNSSWKMFFVHLSNGATYRISLLRTSTEDSRAIVTKQAPFIKKK